jgi:hypothetical protein
MQPNQSPLGLGQSDRGPHCDATLFPCDTYTLTVTMPAGYGRLTQTPRSRLRRAGPTPAAASPTTIFTSSKTHGPIAAQTTARPQMERRRPIISPRASVPVPENATISPVQDGSHNYTIHIVPFQPLGKRLTERSSCFPGQAMPGFGGPDPATPGVLRYQNLYAPPGTSAEESSGEFNIGFQSEEWPHHDVECRTGLENYSSGIAYGKISPRFRPTPVWTRSSGPKRVLFRALGPSVKVNGTTLPGALSDPSMDVFDGNGTLLRTNDNWRDAPNMSEIELTGLAPADDHESAVLLLLPPGFCTSVVRGVGGTTGISLSEAYKLNN